MNNSNLNNNTKKQRLKKFISIIRKASGDASLMYSGNFPKSIKPKIKNLITGNEVINYINYLKSNRLFESLLIIELLFKFIFMIGTISRLKSNRDNILLVKEKNSEIIRKKILDSTANKISKLIEIQKLKKDDFIFFPLKFKEDFHKRAKFLSSYIKKSMIDSNAFPINDIEDISAHCFQATLAMKKFKERGVIAAQKALNHKNYNITLSHYIKINDRELDINEEDKYKINKMINKTFNIYEENDLCEEIESNDDINNSSENFFFDNSNKVDYMMEKKIFSSNVENPSVIENNLFLSKKRKLKKETKKKIIKF